MEAQINLIKLDWQDQLIQRVTTIPNELVFLKEEMKAAFKRNKLSYTIEENQISEMEAEIDNEVCILDDGIDFNDLYY
jgi:hypothetical protein